MTDNSTIKQFDILISDYLSITPKYQSQINNFRKFLSTCDLEDKVFNLYSTHIDKFFREAFKEYIGSESQVTSHISGLKSLFGYLINKQYKFSELNGYISTSEFKKRMFAQVDKTKNKIIISQQLLEKVLTSMDDYIANYDNILKKPKTKEQTYFEILIARIFIKLSLLLPLKTSQMLDINLSNINNNNFRELFYNGIKIKIPNNFRKEILYTINYAQVKYGKIYTDNDRIFHFLYACINKNATTAVINVTLPRIYKELKVPELLENKIVGKKSIYIYPAECYKITAISNMLENGVNIVYLSKLTGLDIGTLGLAFDSTKKIELCDNFSIDLNRSLVTCDYYEYL